MHKPTPLQFWNVLGHTNAIHYEKAVLSVWFPTFDNCELYASFCVLGTKLLAHGVAKLVSDLEERTGKQFVFKVGAVYTFTRIV